MRKLILQALSNIEEIAASVGLILVVGITLFNIVNRYAFQRPGVWAPELAELIFPWVVFLGASAAWKRNMHISISVVLRCLPPWTRTLISVITEIVVVAFLAYAAYLALKITISSHSRLSPVLRIPFSYVYASVALAFGLMLIRRSITLARTLGGFRPEP